MLKIEPKITEYLEDIGLTETESSLYVHGLAYPEVTVNQLVAMTGVNRTTIYHAVGTLKQKGFLNEAKVQGRLVYTMTKPDELQQYFDRKQAALTKQKQQLIELTSLFPVPNADVLPGTHIEKFQGIDGVKQAVEKALYCRAREWRIIAPRDNFFSQVGGEYAQYFMETRRSRKIISKTLWEKIPGKQSSLKLKDIMLRKPRYLPDQYWGKFQSTIILFDDQVLFITSKAGQSAVLIQSKEIHSTLSVLFEGLWATANKP